MRVVARALCGGVSLVGAARTLDAADLGPGARGAVLDPGVVCPDARVLDLFAGSGALAIEALSRGAASATLVDVRRCGGGRPAQSRRRSGSRPRCAASRHFAFLERAPSGGRQYDLVFLDPPYRQASALGRELIDALAPVLLKDARVVAESDRRAPLELGFALLDERRYGDTLIRIHGPR